MRCANYKTAGETISYKNEKLLQTKEDFYGSAYIYDMWDDHRRGALHCLKQLIKGLFIPIFTFFIFGKTFFSSFAPEAALLV